MKTDAEKLLIRITKAQKYVQDIAEHNVAKKWEDMDDAISGISEWANNLGYNEKAELYYQGRQAGRVGLARQILEILGRPLESDEGGLLTYNEAKQLQKENNLLWESLNTLVSFCYDDLRGVRKLRKVDIEKAQLALNFSLQQKDSE